MNKPIQQMTHEEKLQLLRQLKEEADANLKKIQELLAWFITEMRKMESS